MLEFAEAPRDIVIIVEAGKPLKAGDTARRFFEGAWVLKRDSTYYLTHSTGDTQFLVYATAKTPYGPFTYKSKIMEPVEDWTTHHSMVPEGASGIYSTTTPSFRGKPTYAT